MANLLSTSVSGSLSSTGRISTTYNTDRYQFNLSRTSGSNWWFTNDSDKLGLHLNNVGDRIYFATDGNIWSAYYNDWLSNVLANKQNSSTAITTSNIGNQSVNYATTAGSAPANGGTSTHTYRGIIEDTRAGQRTPNAYDDYRVSWEFTNQMPHDSNWLTIMTMQGWHDGYAAWQIMGTATTTAYENWYLRSGVNGTWNAARTIIHSGNIASQSVSYAVTSGTSSATTQTNFSELSIGGLGVATREYVTSQGYLTSLPSHNHDDRYYTESESDGRYVPYGSITGSFGLNDNKLYLRTNGDNNHYLWNAADDWEELVYYTGTGFRVKGSTGTVSATFTDSGISIGTSSTLIRSFDAQGYLRIYGSSTNFLGIGPYNNNGWVYFENSGNSSGIYFNSPGRYAFDSVDVTPYTDNENSLGNGSYRWANIYTGGWLRNYGAQGIYNESYGTHFYSSGGNAWSITGSGGGVELVFRSNHQSTIRGYVYSDTSNQIGFLSEDGSWVLRTWNRGVEAYGSMRAPIFYDSNDTNYYLDPNSTGTALRISGGIVSTAGNGAVLLKHENSEANAWIFRENAANWGLFWFNAGNQSGQTIGSYTTLGAELFGMNNAVSGFNPNSAWSGTDASTRAAWMLSNYSGYLWTQGTQYSETDMRAPIFYDSENTGYYVDPNSNSKLVNLGLGGATPDLRLSVSGDIHMDGYIYQGGTAGVVNSWGSRTVVNSGNYVSNARSFAFNNVGYGSSWTFAIASDGAVTTNRHIDANTTWTNSATTLFLGWYGGKVVIGNNNEANHDNAAGLGGNTIAITNTLYSFEQSNLYYDGSLKLYMGSDGTRNTGWAYHTDNGTGIHWPNNGWHIYPINASDMYIRSGASDCSLKFTKNGTSGSYVHCSSDDNIGFLTTGRSWSLRVDNSGNAFATSSFRAPIFYDSNDTGYYLDPNGTSNLNQISASTSARWGRSGNYWTVRPSIHSGVGYWTGTNGWGTGEGTWANAWKGGFSGWDIWGTGTDHPQGSGYVHAQGIVSGQHYTTTDGGEAYGWMMVGAADAITNRYWLRGKWGTTTSAWTEIMTSNQNTYAWNMDQWVRTTDSVSFVATTSSTFLVNSHSDNTKGYRLYNTSNSSVSAMFTNSSNQLVIAAGAFDQINLNKKVYVNGVALGVNVTPSSTAGRIDASNDIVAYSSSDERLKYNITPIENAIDKVKSLTGVEFDWKPEYKHAHGYEGHDTGIIAQQVQEVIPSAVRTNDTGFLAVRYEKLIGLLIEANKELAARVEELEKKLG